MDPQHPPEVCPHCANGCTHPHDLGDAIPVSIVSPVPAVAGSRMRHGGSFHDADTGLTIASDRWIRLKCRCCGEESMTPVEALATLPWEQHEDDILATCGDCTQDIIDGKKPGHGRRRRRGRRA